MKATRLTNFTFLLWVQYTVHAHQAPAADFSMVFRKVRHIIAVGTPELVMSHRTMGDFSKVNRCRCPTARRYLYQSWRHTGKTLSRPAFRVASAMNLRISETSHPPDQRSAMQPPERTNNGGAEPVLKKITPRPTAIHSDLPPCP
ncbi:hypothetical protein C8R43DRAFT_1027941 [Mycena crocata]|nr:hypothetical protein C8R43DRAFT_1027941 [Mycena crocata]